MNILGKPSILVIIERDISLSVHLPFATAKGKFISKNFFLFFILNPDCMTEPIYSFLLEEKAPKLSENKAKSLGLTLSSSRLIKSAF